MPLRLLFILFAAAAAHVITVERIQETVLSVSWGDVLKAQWINPERGPVENVGVVVACGQEHRDIGVLPHSPERIRACIPRRPRLGARDS